jgi:hypothetical protein
VSSSSVILFLLEAIPEMPCTQNITARDHIADCMCLTESDACRKLHLILHCGVIQPCHCVIYAELCLNSLKNVYYQVLILRATAKTASVNRMCLCGVTGKHMSNATYVKAVVSKLCACLNGFFLVNIIFIWSF